MPSEAEYIDALREWAQHGPSHVELKLDPQTAIAVISSLHLALRHPGNRGPSSRSVRLVIDQVIAGIELTHPLAAEAMRLGDRPEHDVPVSRRRF